MAVPISTVRSITLMVMVLLMLSTIMMAMMDLTTPIWRENRATVLL